MDYQDFTIHLRPAKDGHFEAMVVDSPFRDNPSEPFSRPIEQDALEALHRAFDRPGAELLQPSAPPGVSPRQTGQLLYSTLFGGGVGELFQRCRNALPPDDRTGLRLRLKFLWNEEHSDYLAALPWEWLWDAQSPEFLATDLGTPVVRDIASSQPQTTLEVELPLRILVVDAAPQTMKQLNLKLEFERMTEALNPLIRTGQIELLQLKRATPEDLRDTLRDETIHVLHFMGHGGYDPGSGAGAVFFVKEDGKKDQVDGVKLSSFLKRIPSLRLVVLNACKTARLAGRPGAPLNEGVASAILRWTGVPAVVANQYSISDAAAIAFSEAFYGRIARGDGVDEALTEARLRLRTRTPEWATPVLFLSAPDGKLFSMKPVLREASPVLNRLRPQGDTIRLAVRSIDGWGGDMQARNDHLLDFVDLFDGRYPKKQEIWQEEVFPRLRDFLLKHAAGRQPLMLDFAAHSSIAFAAGWILEPKSGLDVKIRQRTGNVGEFEWHPEDGTEPEGALWLDRPDIQLDDHAADVALALSVSQPNVADHVQEFIRRKGLPVGRIVDAVAPEPGSSSVRGGAHALRLAQALLPRLQRRPHERGGRVHLFCAAPNALVFYLGQLASFLGKISLYEFAFKADDNFGRYRESIELPPPGEVQKVPEGW